MPRCWFLLSGFLNLSALAQPIVPGFETLDVNNGLSQNSVYSIYQDQEGFMWFGTADGLNRYDGDEIKVYKTKTNLRIRGNSNFIRGRLCEDQLHNIWFCTETGIYYYERQSDQVKPGFIFPELRSGVNYYFLFTIDSTQTLWLGSRYLGVYSWNIKTMTWNSFPLHPDTNTNRVFTAEREMMDPSGNIWFSWYQNDGFMRFDIRKKIFEHLYGGKDYQAICFGKGKHFLSSEKYVYRFDSITSKLDSIKLEKESRLSTTFSLDVEDSYGRLWGSRSDEGLYYYDFAAGKMFRFRKNYMSQKSISSDIIRSLFEDRSGNLWVGTDGGGVGRLDLKPPLFNIFPLFEGQYPELKDYFIKSLFEDKKGRIWFGTLNGLHIYDPAEGTVFNYTHHIADTHSLPGTSVSVIYQDKKGNIWIGDNRGVAIFNEQQGKFIPLPVDLSSIRHFSGAQVNKILELQSGDLLVAAVGHLLLVKQDNKGNYYSIDADTHKVIPPTITDITELDNGHIWFVSPLGGLYDSWMINGSFKIGESFFPGIDFRSIHRDEIDHHILWIASGKGLIRFDTDTRKYALFNESNGMANSFIYGILEDEKNNFWMSTNGGLVYFDRKWNAFKNYTANEGLQSNEFNTGAFYKGESGHFYFGGVKGFNWFGSFNVSEKKKKPGIGITSVLVENVPYQKDSLFFRDAPIRLHYYQNDLIFRLAVFDYTRPEANKIKYRLEGRDDDWVTTYNKEIRFGKLLPGSYTLLITAGNNADEWGDEKKIAIIIQSPFWQKTWFYILCSALLVGLIVFITVNLSKRKINGRIRLLEKQQAIDAERDRISKDMHDEVGSGLTRIALMTELINSNQGLDRKTRTGVDEIAGSARKLVDTMSEIIWALNPYNDKLENLLAYLREQTRHYFEPFHEIDYQIHFPDQIPVISLSNEQRRNIFLVTKEALNNALKHAGATVISLSLCLNGDCCDFLVSDNGKGIASLKSRMGSNGLVNMQKRITEIGGKIEWMERDGGGTTVHYRICF
ncbi:MAG: hypothetical protein GC171_16075 [Terrimonas sp.]|nr:hypothetical protein [Terrimonas sp.]